MIVEKLGEINGCDIDNTEDLLDILSQTVLIQTDKEIYNKHLKLEENKKVLNSLKNQLISLKENSEKLSKEYSREKQLSRVLNLIATLKKEGAISGKVRLKVIKLLNDISNMDYHELRDVEEKYSIYQSVK